MIRLVLGSALMAVLTAPPALAQAAPQQAGTAKAITWADLAGDWESKLMTGPRDSVIATMVTTFSADKKVWIRFPGREPVAGRLVAMAGDSVIVDAGPYPSITRSGRMATVRTVMHIGNHKSWGMTHAVFDDGSWLNGKTEGMHKMTNP